MADDAVATVDLTPPERRFVAEYVIDLNGTRAYLKAFPESSYANAKSRAGELRAKPNIAAEIEAAQKEHARQCGIDARRTLRELATVAFADPDDCFAADPANGGMPAPKPWDAIPPRAKRAIQAVKVKRRRLMGGGESVYDIEEVEIRHHSKLDALDKLCKHLGLTKDGAALEQLLALLRENAGKDQPRLPSVSTEPGTGEG